MPEDKRESQRTQYSSQCPCTLLRQPEFQRGREKVVQPGKALEFGQDGEKVWGEECGFSLWILWRVKPGADLQDCTKRTGGRSLHLEIRKESCRAQARDHGKEITIRVARRNSLSLSRLGRNAPLHRFFPYPFPHRKSEQLQ